jgi:predicted AlkP superfamily pyrophosphatase or phosphodiesterase
MKILNLKTAFLIVFFGVLLCFNGTGQTISRPKLIVGIVIDQMRWDYLYRYENLYSVDGFKRMLRDGFSFDNTFIDYLPSFTAAGHAAIYTGSVPAVHGIVGNDWIDQNSERHWMSVEDTSEQSTESLSSAGKASPRNLLASTITDELRIATNFQSKVIGISLKDRAAIIPAGHRPNGAFWFDTTIDNFITSTYYMDKLPAWVDSFNQRKLPAMYMRDEWNTFYPLKSYSNSTNDISDWEGKLPADNNTAFPHDLASSYKKDKGTILYTPFGNSLTLEFAKAAIEGYQLGESAYPDFLTINCASTDYVGHLFGPNSVEIEDTYLRLDKELASFFHFLDQKFGKKNYLLFLTADHGASHSVNYLKENSIPSGFIYSNKLVANLNSVLQKYFKIDNLVLSATNYHINYDNRKIKLFKVNYDSLKKVTIDYLNQWPGIQVAVDVECVGQATLPETIKKMIVNGYNRKRTGPILIIPEPGWFEGPAVGTTHGNWNPYDTHIPLLFMGWHITNGVSNRKIYITDIAPTIAALLHIQMPNGNIGNPIKEIVGKWIK